MVTFLPIIFLFYLILAVIEDSEYLPRAAFLMDGFMRWLELDDLAFVLQIIGFGSNVPSITDTRVIRDRGKPIAATARDGIKGIPAGRGIPLSHWSMA